MLRERYDRLDHRYTELSSSVKQLVRQLGQMHAQQHKSSVNDVKRKRDQAAADGDAEVFTQYDQEYEQLAKEAPPDPQGQGKVDPEFEVFCQDHSWYNDDVDKTLYADQIGQIVARKNPDMTRTQLFKEVGRLVEQKFSPSNERRSRSSAVEGGRSSGKRGKATRTEADLPAEARQAIDRFVEQGLDRKELVKEYMTSYFEEAE